MSFLQELSKEEIKYICEVIPSSGITTLFNQLPKSFQDKIGLINSEDMSKILFDIYPVPIVSKFIEDEVNRYLKDIEEYRQGLISLGESEEEASMHALADSSFNRNIPLYFKLKRTPTYSEEFIRAVSMAVDVYRQSQKKGTVETASPIVEREQELGILKQKLGESEAELSAIKVRQETLEKILTTVKEQLNTIFLLTDSSQECLNNLRRHILNLSEVCESSKGNIIPTKPATNADNIPAADSKDILCPSNMEEFKECLEDNFESMGITDLDTLGLLVDYLSNILFRGLPIITSYACAHSIASCVSNTLYGSKIPDELTYSPYTSDRDINLFMEKSGRVLCLYGFLGNYDELNLSRIVNKFRNKIIFLTSISDRSVFYLEEDFLSHTIYFNANRIDSFSRDSITSADPSKMEECKGDIYKDTSNGQFQKIAERIAHDCHIPPSIYDKWDSCISTENQLCQTLAFSLLPFCRDVNNLKPFIESERLQRYAGYSGACRYKKLLLRWFER